MKSASAFLENNLKTHRAFQVLQRAISGNRLAQAVMLHGENIHSLDRICQLLASEILGISPEKLENYPDVFYLRTRGKGRQINIGQSKERTHGEWPPNTMRRFIHDIHLTPRAGTRKVGIVVEADRMNDSTANAFLKTLEEPPNDTTLFLLTTRPYDLLDTIRSRCLNFGLPTEMDSVEIPSWKGWLNDYRWWLEQLVAMPVSKSDIARVTMAIYGMVTRFELILTEATRLAWERYKQSLPAHLSEEERLALESGVSKSIRQQLFSDLEKETRNFAVHSGTNNPRIFHRRLNRSIDKLEHLTWLMDRVYLHEAAALEAFFLQSLRIWSGR